MDSSSSMKDSFFKRFMDNLNSSEYNGQKITKLTPCNVVTTAAFRACDTGIRSVTQCMATLFCPRPEAKLDVGYYQILTATSELVTPLLSWNPQANPDQQADMELLSDSDSVINDDPLPSLEPLGSVTYESLSDEDFAQFMSFYGDSTDTSLMDSSSFHAEIPQRH